MTEFTARRTVCSEASLRPSGVSKETMGCLRRDWWRAPCQGEGHLRRTCWYVRWLQNLDLGRLLINSEVFSFKDQRVRGSHVTAGFVSVCFRFQPPSPFPSVFKEWTILTALSHPISPTCGGTTLTPLSHQRLLLALHNGLPSVFPQSSLSLCSPSTVSLAGSTLHPTQSWWILSQVHGNELLLHLSHYFFFASFPWPASALPSCIHF